MSRIRTIKPDFWTDEKVVQLPFEARLLFIGMWNFADDEGFLVDEPDRLKLQIFPSDDVDPWYLVDLLIASERLERIIVDGGSLLRIKNFDQHQQISHKTLTKFPASSGKKQSIPAHVRRQLALKYGCEPGKTKNASCYFCGEHGQIIWWPLKNGTPSYWVAFSRLEIDHLIPESSGGKTLIDNMVLSCRYCNRSRGSGNAEEFLSRKFQCIPENSGGLRPEGKGREWNGREDSIPYEDSNLKHLSILTEKPKRSRKVKPEPLPEFEKFWEAYGHKLQRKAAEKAFAKALKITTIDKILSAVEIYHRSRPDWKAIALAASWLNGECWNDQHPPNGNCHANGSGSSEPRITAFSRPSCGAQIAAFERSAAENREKAARLKAERLEREKMERENGTSEFNS